jgi:small subunit ribosomal protein S3
MGQKVNPISMRLQVNKNWRSRWFAPKREYATFLAQDLAVRRFVNDKFTNRGAINSVDIERSPNLVTVTIQTAKAGVVIGRGGAGAQELKQNLKRFSKILCA